MGTRRWAWLPATLFLLTAVPAHAQQRSVVTSPVPPVGIATQVVDVGTGATSVRYLLLTQVLTRPTAAVILFAGGKGLVNITYDGNIGDDLKNNFLVRSRLLFAQKGVAVAVVDPPGAVGIVEATRLSASYAQTMSNVIAELRKRTGVKKVWLVGTSSGTLSAASIAARYPLLTFTLDPTLPSLDDPNPARPNGVVLTSTQTRLYPSPTSPPPPSPFFTAVTCTGKLDEAALSAINVPVHVVAHHLDGCPCSPAGDAPSILTKLTRSPSKDRLEVTGGTPPDAANDVCQANSPHGFLGLDDSVVTEIVNWVKTH